MILFCLVSKFSPPPLHLKSPGEEEGRNEGQKGKGGLHHVARLWAAARTDACDCARNTLLSPTVTRRVMSEESKVKRILSFLLGDQTRTSTLTGVEKSLASSVRPVPPLTSGPVHTLHSLEGRLTASSTGPKVGTGTSAAEPKCPFSSPNHE